MRGYRNRPKNNQEKSDGRIDSRLRRFDKGREFCIDFSRSKLMPRPLLLIHGYSATGLDFTNLVQVETIPAKPGNPKPQVLSLQTDFTHDDVAVDGHFTSGVKLLNQIHALIDRAILSNLASVITDCPTREKLGWLEQTHLAGYSIMDNYGVLKLYEKVADDMGEAQLSDGFVPGIAPEYVAFVDAKGDSTNFRDSPEWAAPASWPPGRPISSTATSRC
jgi:hypothetical protein